MNKAEIHYLNCQDENCEKYACLARRDYERKILVLEGEVKGARKKEATKWVKISKALIVKAELDTLVEINDVLVAQFNKPDTSEICRQIYQHLCSGLEKDVKSKLAELEQMERESEEVAQAMKA